MNKVIKLMYNNIITGLGGRVGSLSIFEQAEPGAYEKIIQITNSLKNLIFYVKNLTIF